MMHTGAPPVFAPSSKLSKITGLRLSRLPRLVLASVLGGLSQTLFSCNPGAFYCSLGPGSKVEVAVAFHRFWNESFFVALSFLPGSLTMKMGVKMTPELVRYM